MVKVVTMSSWGIKYVEIALYVQAGVFRNIQHN